MNLGFAHSIADPLGPLVRLAADDHLFSFARTPLDDRLFVPFNYLELPLLRQLCTPEMPIATGRRSMTTRSSRSVTSRSTGVSTT